MSRPLGAVLLGIYAAHVLLLVATVGPASGAVADQQWLAAYTAPDNGWAIATHLLLTALVCLTRPLRTEDARRPLFFVGLVSSTVVVLGLAAFWSCAGGQAGFWAPLTWTLSLFVGSVEDVFGRGGTCPGTAPLALQVARLGALAALGVSIAVGCGVLFRAQLDALRARVSRSVVLVVGSDKTTADLVQQVRNRTERSTSVVLVDPAGVPVPARGRQRGILQLHLPIEPRALGPVLRFRGRSALRAAYVLGPSPAENESVLAVLLAALPGRTGEDAATPVVRMRIDDTWHAEHWRRANVATDGRWIADALCMMDSTAGMLVDRVVRDGYDHVLLYGDSALALAVCAELTQRRRELASTRPASGPFPTTTLVGPGAQTLLDQHRLRQQRFGNADDTFAVVPGALDDTFLRRAVDDSDRTVLVMARAPGSAAPAETSSGGRSVERTASALAARHTALAIFSWEADAGPLPERPVMERLFPFSPTFATDDPTADAWERAARIAHANYVHDHGSAPVSAARAPWDELSAFHRDNNLRLITTTLTSAVSVGRTWGTVLPATTDGVAPSVQQIERMAALEHESWVAYHRRHGWRHGGVRDDAGRRHDLLLPWAELDEPSRQKARGSVEDALGLLGGLGYRSTDVTGGDAWSRYRRLGEVRARRSRRPWSWRTQGGDLMQAGSGDWRVTGEDGTTWSVRAAEFRESYEHVRRHVWRRTGEVTARPAAAEDIETLEGPVRARAGDWVVRGPRGEMWVVPESTFARTYAVIAR